MKIIFFGTPDIAVPYLEELIKTEEVVGVVTQPDKPSARGQKLHAPPVKELAQNHGIPVFQPVKFDESLETAIKGLKADAGVVVSYGRLIPEKIFTAPFFGCFNIHFSLLPKYRGAGPVQWALIKGEKETGVTTFWIEKTLDSGPVLVRKSAAIGPEDDAGTLFKKLIPLGIEAMNETLRRLKNNDCAGVPQQGEPSFAPCLKKENGRIDWSRPAREIADLVRGARLWPGAFAVFSEGKMRGKTLKFLKAAAIDGEGAETAPGTISGLDKDRGFIVQCGKGRLVADEVHPENRKPMSAWAFWQGGHLEIGNKFEQR